MTRSPLTIAFDAALLAGDFAVGSFLGTTLIDVVSGDAAASATPIGRALPWAALGAVVAHVAALAALDVHRLPQGVEMVAGRPARIAFWFYALVVAMITTTAVAAGIESFAGPVEGTAAVVLGAAGLAVVAPGYGRLCMWASRPAPRSAPAPSRIRIAASLALMLPVAVLALGPVDGLAFRADVAGYDGTASRLLAAAAGAAVLAGLGWLIAYWPRLLVTRAAGCGLSGRGFFLGLWSSYLIRLLREPLLGLLGG